MPATLRVIVAETHVLTRETMVEILRSDSEIDVVGMARSGEEAVESTMRLRPDIVVMGVRLHKLDGFEATKEIMIACPTPIVLVARDPDSHDVELSLLALKAGALTVVEAPSRRNTPKDALVQRKFLSTIKAMSQVKVVRHRRDKPRPPYLPPQSLPRNERSARIIAVAASTGGPAALQVILSQLPTDFQIPILVVQHISGGFVEGLASWLHLVTPFTVKLAEDGEPLRPRTVYFAADEHHIGVAGTSRILLTDEPPIGGFRPSANYLFRSVASFGSEALAIMLTGMGEDGVEGLRALHQAGGTIIAQDEASSVVFGMPRAAIENGLVHHVYPISGIAQAMISSARPIKEDER